VANRERAVVISVVTVDTIDVRLTLGVVERIRLIGIDTPKTQVGACVP
jgi:endonuclease YncB( thermonuclease family)